MHTFLKLLQTLKCDLELVRSQKRRGVVQHLDTEQGNNRHDDNCSSVRGNAFSDGAKSVVKRKEEARMIGNKYGRVQLW